MFTVDDCVLWQEGCRVKARAGIGSQSQAQMVASRHGLLAILQTALLAALLCPHGRGSIGMRLPSWRGHKGLFLAQFMSVQLSTSSLWLPVDSSAGVKRLRLQVLKVRGAGGRAPLANVCCGWPWFLLFGWALPPTTLLQAGWAHRCINEASKGGLPRRATSLPRERSVADARQWMCSLQGCLVQTRAASARGAFTPPVHRQVCLPASQSCLKPCS